MHNGNRIEVQRWNCVIKQDGKFLCRLYTVLLNCARIPGKIRTRFLMMLYHLADVILLEPKNLVSDQSYLRSYDQHTLRHSCMPGIQQPIVFNLMFYYTNDQGSPCALSFTKLLCLLSSLLYSISKRSFFGPRIKPIVLSDGLLLSPNVV